VVGLGESEASLSRQVVVGLPSKTEGTCLPVRPGHPGGPEPCPTVAAAGEAHPVIKGNAVTGRPPHALWTRVQTELLKQVGPDRCNLWIRQARMVRWDDEECVISFRDAYVRDKLVPIFHKAVTASLQSFTNRKTRVNFTTDGEISDTARPAHAGERSPIRETLGTFIVGAPNRIAFEACRHFAEGPPSLFKVLLIHGGTGLGKTHLLRGMAHAISGRSESLTSFHGVDFVRRFVAAVRDGDMESFRKKCRSTSCFLLDDLQEVAGKEKSQLELQHILKEMIESDRRIGLTSDRPPSSLPGLSRGLKSLLAGAMVVGLERPDFETRLAFLRSKAPARCPPEALESLANAITSNMRDLSVCLEEMVERGESTPEGARQAAARFHQRRGQQVTLPDIIRETAHRYGIREADLLSRRRTPPLPEARAVCFTLARRMLGQSFPRLGAQMALRNASAIRLSVRKLERDKDSGGWRMAQALERELTRGFTQQD